MTVGIYCIENKVNGKKYIGQSINIDKRLKHHIERLVKNSHYNVHLQNSWNKYGEENFKFYILEETKNNTRTLDKREKYWIEYYKSRDIESGFNIKVGGNSQSGKNNLMFGRQQTEKTKLKISEAMVGKGKNKKFNNSSSKYLGVSWNSEKNKWMVYFWKNPKKSVFVGYYKDEKEAALAYDKYIKENNIDRDTNF